MKINSAYAFDYDATNGVTSGKYDFETIATHEILHALGFNSAVDVIAANYASGATSGIIYPTPLDLFRLKPVSQRGTFASSPRLLTTGSAYATPMLFDGGVFDPSGISGFSGLSAGDVPVSTGQGTYYGTSTQIGDGNQASHWKDDDITGFNIGVMDPTVHSGVVSNVRTVDQRMLGLIGLDVSDTGRAIMNEDGSLSVRGGSGNDTIVTTRSSDASGSVYIAQINGVKGYFSNISVPGSPGITNYPVTSITIEGGGGADSIVASSRAETISGGSGNDTINSGNGGDLVTGDAGDDALIGGTGNDSLNGGDGNDSINGGDGNDSLRDDAGVDSLSGENGNDTLDAKDDTIDATLKGGAGTDTAYYDLTPNESSIVNSDIESATGL